MSNLALCSALVVSDDGHDIVVILDNGSADGCAGCGIALFCRSDACRRIKLRNPGHRRYRPGDRVEVAAHPALKRTALLLFFVVPLVLMVASAAAGTLLEASEPMCALWAFGAVVIWYLIMFVFRGRIGRSARWRLLTSD